MKVLITGVAGLIGKNLAETLVHKNYNVIGLDKKYNSEVKKLITNLYEIDLYSENLKDIVKDVDVIIHLAGESELGKNSRIYKDNNELASINLIDTAIECNVKKIIFISSIKNEMKDNYSLSKRAVENYIKNKTNSSDLKFTIIRCASVYGMGMKSNIAKWIWLIKESSMPYLPKSNTQIAMIGMKDLCACINESITNKKTNNKTYQLTDGNKYNINNIEKCVRINFNKNSIRVICPRIMLFIVAKVGDLLSKININIRLNTRIYNFLFHNQVVIENEYCNDTGYKFTQNFIDEISEIFGDKNNLNGN